MLKTVCRHNSWQGKGAPALLLNTSSHFLPFYVTSYWCKSTLVYTSYMTMYTPTYWIKVSSILDAFWSSAET